MSEVSVAIVGGGMAAINALRSLHGCPGVKVCAVVAAPPDGPLQKACAELKVEIVAHWRAIADTTKVFIDMTPQSQAFPELRRELPRSVAVISGTALRFTDSLLAQLDRLARTGDFAELLEMALQVVREGVEIADAQGIIQYMNPACMTILGIDPRDRIGKNVFDVSPDGAIAGALRTGAPKSGLRNRPVGTTVEVVSNSSPFYRGNKLAGAVAVFRDITEIRQLSHELEKNKALVESLYDQLGAMNQANHTFRHLVGENEQLQEAVRLGQRAATSSSTVLIEGETGTGKEIMAHAIHSASDRRSRAFIKVNCAAIPEPLLESEFFGYEKGAFTGAARRKPGKLELANGGTIFLDEIGDMSPALQVKLLRVLQDREFHRVGGNEPVRVDVRVIAATNANLAEMIEKGLFRRDLFYRLNVINIKLPALRNRRDDIPLLVSHLLQQLSVRLGVRVRNITPEAEALLLRHPWPGNVRELENMLERLVQVLDHDTITESDLRHYSPGLISRPSLADGGLITLAEAERTLIKRALDTYGTTLEGKKKAAEALGISLSTLYNKIRSTLEQVDS